MYITRNRGLIMPQIRHIQSGNVYTVSQTPVYSGGVWECGDQRFIDVGGAYEIPTDIAPQAASINALIAKIDADVDDVVSAILGRRETEYLLAETQALAYIAANYTGTVPVFVQDWATAKNQTATWAADSIAATATSWRAAQSSMRGNRLQHKEDARNAATIADLGAVETSWNAYFASLKTSLGL